MKTRTPARFFLDNPTSYNLITALCHQLDHAIAPVATASLVLGLVAAVLQISRTADYLMATGLLLHLTVWFAGWWEAVRRR